MKKIVVILSAIALLAACSKEPVQVLESAKYNENGEMVAGSRTMYLTASIPDMTGIGQTKASVDNSTHTWTDGDAIAVPKSGGGYLSFVYSTATGKFAHTLVGGEAVASGDCFYPARYKMGSYSTDFADKDEAAAGFIMKAAYTVGDTGLTFTHESAMLYLNITNVPSFATSIEVKEGSTTVATVALSSPTSPLEVKVPVPPSESAATYTINLIDDNSNVIKSVKETNGGSGITLTAGNYYKTPDIAVGKILTFTNTAGWDSPKVHIWQHDNTSNNTDITTGGSYPHKLNVLASGKYYTVLDNKVESWTAEGNGIGVQFVSTTNSSNTTETSCVYLLRNIDFTIPAGGGIKTDYMVYPYKSGSNTSVAIKSVSAIITDWKTGSLWEDKYWTRINIWNSGVYGLDTTWGDNGDGLPLMEVNGSIYYYVLEGKTPTKTFNFQFKRAGEGQTSDFEANFTSNNTASYIGSSVSVYSTSIAEKNITITTSKSAANYLTLSSSYYGKYVLLKLGDSTYWPILVNRDYDYGY